MSGGWRVGRFALIGGLICAAVGYAYYSGGATETAQAYGVVPRITGVQQTGGYQEAQERETRQREPQAATRTEDRGVQRRDVDRRVPQSSGGRGRNRADDFMQNGLKAGIGGFKAEEKVLEAAWSRKDGGSDFKKSGSKCWLPPGAFIPVQSVTRIITEKPGIVKAKVTVDIWDTSGTCLVLPAGSDLVADYAATATRGEKRVPISNMEIVRPYPADDVVTINGVGGDEFGAAGIPGETQTNFISTALLVTASVGLELATAALTDGGSLIGPIIGRNASNPLDQIANDLWNRPSVNKVDERSDMLLILRQGIKGDDFRNH